MLDFPKMAVILSVLWITAATTMTLASAQVAALSEGERRGLGACLVKCPDGDKACNNRCIPRFIDSPKNRLPWGDFWIRHGA